MDTLTNTGTIVLRLTVAILLVFSLAVMFSSELVVGQCGDCCCDDHGDDSDESCSDCVSCLPTKHLMLCSSPDSGNRDLVCLWSVASSSERLDVRIAADIDHPPQNLS